MNMSKTASVAILMVAIATSAMAQSTAKKDALYGELGYTTFNYSEYYSNATYTWSSGTAYRVIIGADLDDSVAIEGLYASGLSSGALTISGYSTYLALNSTYGFYVKPKLKVNENATLFARVGYAQSKGTLTAPSLNYSSTLSNSSLSYGLGASYKINDSMSVNGDYMVYYNNNSAFVNGMTIGIGYRF
jgi:opacity protein-like surface antigen